MGVHLLGTQLDGDCAFDVMTQMAGLPQTLTARNEVRGQVSDYLIAHAKEPWMRHLMVALQELELEDVLLCGDSGIDFDDDSKVDSQVYPRVIRTLEGVVSFGLEPKQKLESLLKPQRSDNWRDPSSWKLPRAVLIAAARGVANVSEEMKKTIGRIIKCRGIL